MNFEIKKASKSQAKARVALMGPPGAGKTFSALNVAKHLGGRIIVIDTERGSASKYADEFDFDVIELDTFNPKTYIAAIKAAEDAGADVIIIDSLSHAWMGKDGALEMVDRAASSSRNSFTAWKDVTPLHNALVDAILRSKAHVFATLRTKTEYVIEANERGKLTPRKVGLGAVQRDGIEYEFDIVGTLDMENNLTITKTRCRLLSPNDIVPKPGKGFAETLTTWLTSGVQATSHNEADDASLVRLRERVREGLLHIGLTEESPKVVARMLEQYGATELAELTREQLADLERYINSVADRQAQKQTSQIKAVS
ncbi:MAG: ATP-binding protein [Acidobacteria bacterium]|nr:ATP-binding protein [Acidobacteriota bacterium]